MADSSLSNLIDDDTLNGSGNSEKAVSLNENEMPITDSDKTYSEEEDSDVNKIEVTVADKSTPIVVFFGSPSSGKTLALFRMVRYLDQLGYSVLPDVTFRPGHDKHFKRMCTNLNKMVYSSYTPGGTDAISFMLVKVLDSIGNPVCQFLEAPGEHYFDPEKMPMSFPRYINEIHRMPNRKIWVFFVEQDMGDATLRMQYANKIKLMQNWTVNDKIIFLFNKVDKQAKTQFLPNGRPNTKVFFQNIKNQYPGIFTRYQNTSFLSKILYGEYNFKAICFSSGIFTYTNDKQEIWTQESDEYCTELWNAITR